MLKLVKKQRTHIFELNVSPIIILKCTYSYTVLTLNTGSSEIMKYSP